MPNAQDTIMTRPFPTKLKIKGLSNDFEEVIELIRAIRNARAGFNVPDNKRTSIYLCLEREDKTIEENLDEISKLAFGTECKIVTAEPNEKCVKVISGQTKAYLPMGQLVDSDKEKARLEKEIESVKFEIQRSEKMLSNAGFVAKAPADMVEKEKSKLEDNKSKLARLENELKSM